MPERFSTSTGVPDTPSAIAKRVVDGCCRWMYRSPSSIAAACALICSLAFGACSFSDPAGAEIRVAFGLNEEAAVRLDASAFTVSARIDDGERIRLLGRPDFTTANGRRYSAGPFKISSSGTASVSCTLAESDGSESRAITTGTVGIDLRSGVRYGVDCIVGEENPHPTCLGCFGYAAFPLDSTLGLPPSDSLFILWGGNSISNPVDY
jgi:hypothetical protein